MKKQMSKRAATALDDLIEAAQDWGWQSDQGSGSDVDTSKRDYERARDNMEELLIKLETANRRLRQKLMSAK